MRVSWYLLVCKLGQTNFKKSVKKTEETSGKTDDIEWQRMTASGTTTDNEWQPLMQRVTMSDTTNDNKW